MRPDDIYWVEFPARGGHAQAGRRPAIVFLPLTMQMDALRFPGMALVETTPENGLKRPSVALAFQLTVIDKQFIGAYLGTLSEAAFAAVRQALGDITQHP